jgi:hypothetical protein
VSYDFRYINKQKEPTYTSFTLIIEDKDNDELVDIYRIEKVFKLDEKLIDNEFLRAEARKEISRIIEEQSMMIIGDPQDGNVN